MSKKSWQKKYTIKMKRNRPADNDGDDNGYDENVGYKSQNIHPLLIKILLMRRRKKSLVETVYNQWDD